MKISSWQKALVLHARPYRESHLIVDLFTETEGRLSLLAMQARKPKSPFYGLLQPFTPLNITYEASHSWFKLAAIDPLDLRLEFTPMALACAFYLNELLYHLLKVGEAADQLFRLYEHSLTALSQKGASVMPILRHFERQLLALLGYGVSFCAADDKPLVAESYYVYQLERGFTLSDAAQGYSGEVLQQIADENWNKNSLQQARRLFGRCLGALLGPITLKSRELIPLKGGAL